MLGFSNDKHNVLLGKGYRIWGKSNPQGFSLMIAEDPWSQDPRHSWVHRAKTNTSLQQKDFQIFSSTVSFLILKIGNHLIFSKVYSTTPFTLFDEKNLQVTHRSTNMREGRTGFLSITFTICGLGSLTMMDLFSFFAKWVPSRVLWGLNEMPGWGATTPVLSKIQV